MKKLLTLATMVALILGLASCSMSDDATELLDSVPEKASAVAVINIDKLINDAGMQADGDKVELSRQLRQLTKDLEINPLDLLSTGAIRHTSAAIFIHDEITYMTGFVADEEAFVKFFEDIYDEKFATESGMNVISSNANQLVAIVDGRFWFTTEDGLSNIKKYINLDIDRSLSSTPVAEELISEEQDITAMLSMSYLMEQAQTHSNSSDMQQLSALFDMADYLTLNCRFEEGKIMADAYMYDKKFERLQYTESSSYFTTINKGTLDCMRGEFEMVVAVGISSKLATYIGTLVSTIAGIEIPSINDIDGTIAIAFNPSATFYNDSALNNGMLPIMAAIKTKNSQAADALGSFIKQMVGSDMGVSQKGSTLLLRTDDFSDSFSVGECQSDLDGAYAGVVVSPSMLRAAFPSNTIPFKGASLTLRPDEESFKLELKILTGSDKNSLATIISLLAAIQKENL